MNRIELKRCLPFILASAAMIVLVLIYAGYSLPCADDFSNAVYIRNPLSHNNGSFLLVAIKSLPDFYKMTGGYYFGLFTNYFFSPFLRFGVPGVRIFNVFVNIIFFCSLFFFIRTAIKELFGKNIFVTWFVYCVFLFFSINNYKNSEAYTWYVIMAAYMIPFSCMLIGVALYMAGIKNKKLIYIVLSAILGFLASGTSLNISALNCGLYILVAMFAIYAYGIKKEIVIPVIVTVVGGLINVCAPGNFQRHTIISSEYSVFPSLVNAFKELILRARYLTIETLFIPIAIVVFIVLFIFLDYKEIKKIKFSHPVFMAFLFVFGVLVVDYPVFLGYGGLPDRSIYIQDLTIYILFFAWMFYFIGFIKNKFPDFILTNNVIFCVLLTCCLSIFNSFAIIGVQKYTSVYMLKNLLNGSTKKFVSYELGILNEIQNSLKDDVLIVRSERLYNDIIVGTRLQADENDWVNVAVASFYSKKSVAIKYENIK